MWFWYRICSAVANFRPHCQFHTKVQGMMPCTKKITSNENKIRNISIELQEFVLQELSKRESIIMNANLWLRKKAINYLFETDDGAVSMNKFRCEINYCLRFNILQKYIKTDSDRFKLIRLILPLWKIDYCRLAHIQEQKQVP